MRGSSAIAVAHPNIALAKYWGKRERPGNYPAVPSLSVTLCGLATRTGVTFEDSLRADEFVLNGEPASPRAHQRVVALLDDLFRGRDRRYARVDSNNDFPTGSGLASSASGFAALALAATHAAGFDWDRARISDLARRDSASAARSLFGGYVSLAAGPLDPGSRGALGSETFEEDVLGAEEVATASALPLKVLVCVTSERQKELLSRAGMNQTRQRSPYYAAWLERAPMLYEDIRRGIETGDFDRVGRGAETSALLMHACAMGGEVLYFRGATVDLLHKVRSLRERGVGAYATVDAGPHVKVLVRPEDEDRIRNELMDVPGVLRILVASPGPGAWIESSAQT